MQKNEKVTTTTTTTKSIIDVQVNGITCNQAIKLINTRLLKIDNLAFNAALLCAYCLGDTIPEHVDAMGNTHGVAVNNLPYKSQKELCRVLDKSEATISRWLSAYRYIVKEGYFALFANGILPFAYDKIIIIFENSSCFEGFEFNDLMGRSYARLKKDVAEFKATDDTTEATTQATTEATTDDTTEIFYKNKKYVVNCKEFEQWLQNNATIIQE